MSDITTKLHGIVLSARWQTDVTQYVVRMTTFIWVN